MSQQCIDPIVGKILVGWRYDISGLAPEMRGDYESHFAECEYCRGRQEIHQDDPDHYHVSQSIPTPDGSRNMGLDPVTHKLFVVSAKFGPAPDGKRAPVLPGTFSLMVIGR